MVCVVCCSPVVVVASALTVAICIKNRFVYKFQFESLFSSLFIYFSFCPKDEIEEAVLVLLLSEATVCS